MSEEVTEPAVEYGTPLEYGEPEDDAYTEPYGPEPAPYEPAGEHDPAAPFDPPAASAPPVLEEAPPLLEEPPAALPPGTEPEASPTVEELLGSAVGPGPARLDGPEPLSLPVVD